METVPGRFLGCVLRCWMLIQDGCGALGLPPCGRPLRLAELGVWRFEERETNSGGVLIGGARFTFSVLDVDKRGQISWIGKS